MEQTREGVIVRDLTRSYGSHRVLDMLDMNVEPGSIYALLGPSGSGKTTLLKLLLGRLEPDSGSVFVLGQPPNARSHPVPGPAVGYSPQEVALHEDLSIGETLLFYSSLNQMSTNEYQSRKQYLLEMLDLPSEKRIVKTLSGGQQRRVSLAVALLHNPELLILDEPTVGVDPMLRARIWDYLRDITQKTGVTVIITTHYIEEARGADRVGLMRHGKLLAEAHPETLISEYRATNLEDVFLQLCRAEHYKKEQQHDGSEAMEKGHVVVERRAAPMKKLNKFPSINEEENSNEHDGLLAKRGAKKSRNCCVKSLQHVFAIARRKLTQLLRNWRLFAFELLLPVIQVFLILSAIGADPHNLKVAVFNEDQGTPYFGIHIADQYLKYFAPNTTDMLALVNVSDFNTGYKMVENAQAWGFLHFGPDFSTGLLSRINFPGNQTYINQSTIYTYLDMSNYQVSALILRQMQTAFEELSEKQLGYNMNPINLSKPVYGSMSTTYVAFIAPGMIVMTTFAFSIGLTALAFVREKSDGCLDRVFSTGVKARSVIGGHFLTHSLIGVVQTIFLLIEVVYIFKIPVAGLVVYVFAMMLILQFAGMSLGLLISTVSTSERDAVQLTLGSFFPVMILSGILWPVEAIPPYLLWITKALPTMWGADAMRSVMIRGWGMDWQGVWESFLITGAWAFVLVVLASFNLSEKERRWWWKLTRCCRKQSTRQ